ncbi:MAG TPA: glycosyl hydrolase [Solirubrobacteraceae bacterium]|nr:glycosyl hydrolase [Solirubrobacteraceae bacterium]
MLRSRVWIIAAAVVAVAVVPVAHPAIGAGARASGGSALLGGLNIDGLGSNPQPSEADHSIAVASELHAKVVRVELPWATLEPSHQGETDARALAFTDRLMADARAAGIGVIAMVRSTPCWATSAPAALRDRCTPGRESRANAWAPRDPAALGAFMAFLATRYGSALAALEVWNEPDQSNENYLAGPGKARHYAAMLRAAYTAIKQANPAVTVLGGSLVGSNGAFLRALYAAGIKGYYDGFAVHFYTLTIAALRSFRAVQVANGDTKPLWLDEFGWSSCWPRMRIQEEQACVTPRIQALNITNTIRELARVPYVAAALLFKLEDSHDEEFGVLSERGRHKPSFAGLASALARPGAAVSPVRLRLRHSHGGVVAVGTAPVGDFMELEAFQGSALRYRAIFLLNRFNAFSLKLPRVLGQSGLQVAVFQYGQGPSPATRARI